MLYLVILHLGGAYILEIMMTSQGIKLIESARKEKTIRELKGNSLIAFPADYTLVDIETTGLDPRFDSIIEIGAVKVRDNKTISSFNTLVRPESAYKEDGDTVKYVSSFITSLTGISNDLLEKEGISEIDAITQFKDFIKEDILVGYNVNFDINFLYDAFITQLVTPMNNSFVDVLRIARKQLKGLKKHRLKDLMSYYDVSSDHHHRATEDCYITEAIFTHLKSDIVKEIGLDEFTKTVRQHREKVSANKITTEITKFDEDNLCFGKYMVFTGKLENMIREEAFKLVKDLGGTPQDNVTSQTNYLVLGDITYSTNVKGNATGKQKKAEKLKLGGQDIEILSESVFYDMLP